MGDFLSFLVELMYYTYWRVSLFLIVFVGVNFIAFFLMNGGYFSPKMIFLLFNGFGNAITLNLLILTKPYFEDSLDKKIYAGMGITILSFISAYTIIYQFLS